MAEVAEAVALLGALREQVAAVTEHGRGLLRRLRSGGLRTDKGLSLLGVRAQALLQYLGDLGLLLATKCRGGALGALPALPRLLETRLVLEKSRPMELRLRYHLDKLLRAAATGAPGANDPLRFRPQPGNMGEEEEEEEEEEDEEGPSATKAPGLGGGRRYVPPRLVPVQYDEAGPEREQRALAAARRRALGSALVRELREELGDAPEEVGGANGLRPSREEEQRTRLEESLLVRLAETRRQRAQRRRRALGAPPLGSITHFGAAPALLGAPEQVAPKRRKTVAKRGRGRRRGGRRRR